MKIDIAKVKLIGSIIYWWRHREQERSERRRLLDHRRVIQRRYSEFESNPAKHTRSPWIRSLIDSPLWNTGVRPPGGPKKVSLSHPEKAKGRDYILDLLRLERCIRFRGYEWAWQGIFSAMGDDAITATYPEEYQRLFDELRVTCPDETLRRGRGSSKAQVLGLANGMIAAGPRSIPRKLEDHA